MKINNKVNVIYKKMSLNMLCKIMAYVFSMLYTTLLLNYLGDEKYGAWVTILSVINWLTFFDLGIGNSIRNILTEYIDKKEYSKARSQIIGGYILLAAVSLLFWIVGTVLIKIFKFTFFIKTSFDISTALVISLTAICVTFALSVSKSIIYAVRHTEWVGILELSIQIFNVIGIVFLKIISIGNINYVALVICLNSIFLNVILTIIIIKKYNFLRFQARDFSVIEIKRSCKLGWKYLVMQINSLVIFCTDAILINNIFGSAQVTPYYIIKKIFDASYMVMFAFIEPVRTEITILFVNRKYVEMKQIYKKMTIFLYLYVFMVIVLAAIFKPLSFIWLGKMLNYSLLLLISIAAYYVVFLWGQINAILVNAIDRVNLELILGTIAAILNIPLSIYLSHFKSFNTAGVVCATVILLFISEILMNYDIYKFFKKLIGG